MFELYQLRYFLAVVETGSFTKAAERVYVTQPTLSAGIAKLEAGLGARLFDRGNRRVALTRAGTRFLVRAKTIQHECSLASRELGTIEEPQVLRLGALMTIPARLVACLISAYRRTRNGVGIELFDGTEQELINRLDQGQIDVALTVLRGAGSVLFSEPYTLALSARHPLARGACVEIDQISQEPVIIRTRCEVLSETSRFFTDHNLRPPISYRTDQDERALALIAAGIGLTTMPDCYRAAGVVRLPLRDFDYGRTIGLIESPHVGEGERADLITGFMACATALDWPALIDG